jgi:hypothetical protein
MRWVAVVLGVAWVRAAAAFTSGPAPCADVRFVSDVPIVAGARQLVVTDVAGQVAIPGFCEPAGTRWRMRSDGSALLKARWAVCGEATRVRIRMHYLEDCSAAEGVLRMRRVRRVMFTAVPSTCADGFVDEGEACDTTTTTFTSTTTTLLTTTTTPIAPTTSSTTTVPPSTTTSSTSSTSVSTTSSSSSTTTVASTTTTSTSAPGSTTSTTVAGGLFTAPNPWNTDVSGYPVSPQSSTIIDALAAAGGWGAGDNFQIDFSMHLLHVDPTTPFVTFAANPGYYTPDCDDPFPFPMPVGGAIEGQAGYSCTPATDDCHLLVVDAAAKRLYEAYQTAFSGGTLSTTCGLFWDLTRSYPANGRGEQCTSADAAGFPIGAMLFTADEVAAGEIAHAIRFILPNARMRAGVYVHPASHAGAPSGGSNLPPYGVRFRLRADFPMTGYSANEQVILRALQKYGMLLSDGGNIALTAASDTYTTAKWDDLGIDSHSLFGVQVTDMEVVDLGPTIPITYDCVRNP